MTWKTSRNLFEQWGDYWVNFREKPLTVCISTFVFVVLFSVRRRFSVVNPLDMWRTVRFLPLNDFRSTLTRGWRWSLVCVPFSSMDRGFSFLEPLFVDSAWSNIILLRTPDCYSDTMGALYAMRSRCCTGYSNNMMFVFFRKTATIEDVINTLWWFLYGICYYDQLQKNPILLSTAKHPYWIYDRKGEEEDVRSPTNCSLRKSLQDKMRTKSKWGCGRFGMDEEHAPKSIDIQTPVLVNWALQIWCSKLMYCAIQSLIG